MKKFTHGEKRMIAAESTLLLTMLTIGLWLAMNPNEVSKGILIMLVLPFMVYGISFVIFNK